MCELTYSKRILVNLSANYYDIRVSTQMPNATKISISKNIMNGMKKKRRKPINEYWVRARNIHAFTSCEPTEQWEEKVRNFTESYHQKCQKFYQSYSVFSSWIRRKTGFSLMKSMWYVYVEAETSEISVWFIQSQCWTMNRYQIKKLLEYWTSKIRDWCMFNFYGMLILYMYSC